MSITFQMLAMVFPKEHLCNIDLNLPEAPKHEHQLLLVEQTLPSGFQGHPDLRDTQPAPT